MKFVAKVLNFTDFKICFSSIISSMDETFTDKTFSLFNIQVCIVTCQS